MARLVRLVVVIVLAWRLVLAPFAVAQQGPDHPDGVGALNAQVIKLYSEGKYSEAIPRSRARARIG